MDMWTSGLKKNGRYYEGCVEDAEKVINHHKKLLSHAMVLGAPPKQVLNNSSRKMQTLRQARYNYTQNNDVKIPVA